MNFRASWDFSPYHPVDMWEIKLDTNVRVIGPLYVNLGIGGGEYPDCDLWDYWCDKEGFHLSLGTEIQYPLVKGKFLGLYGQPISVFSGVRFLEYIGYNPGDTLNFTFYGGINLLSSYFGIVYRIKTWEGGEGAGDDYDPSGFFLSLGLRFGF
jgi:hypothetical protein